MPSRGRLSSCVKHVPAMGRVAFYKLWAIISVSLRATCAASATEKKRAGRSGKRKHRWVLIAEEVGHGEGSSILYRLFPT